MKLGVHTLYECFFSSQFRDEIGPDKQNQKGSLFSSQIFNKNSWLAIYLYFNKSNLFYVPCSIYYYLGQCFLTWYSWENICKILHFFPKIMLLKCLFSKIHRAAAPFYGDWLKPGHPVSIGGECQRSLIENLLQTVLPSHMSEMVGSFIL